MSHPTREEHFPQLGRGHRAIRQPHQVKGTDRFHKLVPCGCEVKRGVVAKDHFDSNITAWVEERGGRVRNRRGDYLPLDVILDTFFTMTGLS